VRDAGVQTELLSPDDEDTAAGRTIVLLLDERALCGGGSNVSGNGNGGLVVGAVAPHGQKRLWCA
jgi:hypothetical protein